MAFTLLAARKNAMLDTFTTAAGASCTLVLYAVGGGIPANADAAPSAPAVLCTLPCSSTFAAAAAGGVLTANAITQTNASASGTAVFYRLLAGGTTCIAQGTVGTSGSDLNLNTNVITSGGPVQITGLTITI